MKELGAVLAIAHVRGGGEFGQAWHDAGRKRNRQNAINDFIAAAEFLCVHGISIPDKLAILGGSNAGLLVAVAMTQRPKLFGAVLCIAPLLDMLRYQHERCRKTEYALVSSLQRDPILADRIKRLRTIPGVGPITALTWALEIGDVSRFQSVKQAISYCGLCSAERSSADKLVRMPISKQRNKHIQQVLVQASETSSSIQSRTGSGL
jgi:hypothetical protein